MFILDREGIAETALPVDALAAHLRLPEGWDAVPGQRARLAMRMRAGIAEVEARVGKALLVREFAVEGVARAARVAVPLAPLVAIEAVRLDGRAAAPVEVVAESHATVLVLPGAPVDARLRVEMRAGYGAAWEDSPASLREAALATAGALDAGEETPPLVDRLLAPWRRVRLGMTT